MRRRNKAPKRSDSLTYQYRRHDDVSMWSATSQPQKTTIWRLIKLHSNDKLLEKITSSSYHMEQKTFIEASYIYNVHTGENIFLQLLLLKVCKSLRFGQIRKLRGYLVCMSLLLLLWRREDQLNTVYVKHI